MEGHYPVLSQLSMGGYIAMHFVRHFGERFGNRLAEFSLPTLVICGEQDTISPVGEMLCIFDQLPNSRFVVIPNAGHLSPIESPKEFSATVEKFFDVF